MKETIEKYIMCPKAFEFNREFVGLDLKVEEDLRWNEHANFFTSPVQVIDTRSHTTSMPSTN